MSADHEVDSTSTYGPDVTKDIIKRVTGTSEMQPLVSLAGGEAYLWKVQCADDLPSSSETETSCRHSLSIYVSRFRLTIFHSLSHALGCCFSHCPRIQSAKSASEFGTVLPVSGWFPSVVCVWSAFIGISECLFDIQMSMGVPLYIQYSTSGQTRRVSRSCGNRQPRIL